MWSPTATARPGRPSRWVSPGRAPDLRTPRSSNRPWALTSGHGLLALSPVGTAEACGAAWGGGRVPTAGNRQRGGGGGRPGGRGRVSATGTKRPPSHLEAVRGSKSVCVWGGGWTQPPSTPATDGGRRGVAAAASRGGGPHSARHAARTDCSPASRVLQVDGPGHVTGTWARSKGLRNSDDTRQVALDGTGLAVRAARPDADLR